MQIVVTGGAGFLGSRFIASLLAASDSGQHGLPSFEKIISVDLAECPVNDTRVFSLIGDISNAEFVRAVINPDTTAVCHFAAVVSGQAEADFDVGMRVNLYGTLNILERCRNLLRQPKLLFASSLAVFGGDLPPIIMEDQVLSPRSSYGVQKAIGELLVLDYARRRLVEGVALRLPTVVVRPGQPNAAASSFASGIIREPLAGTPSICPVDVSTRMWLTSPRVVVDNLVHALTLDIKQNDGPPILNLPGISVTVGEMLDSLERVAGTDARALVKEQHDPDISRIVCSWPGDFDVSRPVELGFRRDEDFDSVVSQHIAEHT